MKKKELFTLCALGFALFVLFNNAYAQDSDKDKLGPYKLLTTIDVGVLNGFDISWVDSETGRYYLTNRGDATLTPKVGPSIPVIDTRRNKFLYAIPLSNAGNGVVVIHRGDDGDEEEGPGTLVVGTTPNVVVPPTPPARLRRCARAGAPLHAAATAAVPADTSAPTPVTGFG